MKKIKFGATVLVFVMAASVFGQAYRPANFGSTWLWDQYIKTGTMTLTNKTLTAPVFTGAIVHTTTNALTSGTYRSYTINHTQTGASYTAIIEALRVNITAGVMTGDWVNAVVGRIAYSTGGTAGGGMAAAMCSELVLPPTAAPAGSYYAHDFEFDASDDYTGVDGTGHNVGYLRFGLYGDVTAIASFEDESYFMHLSTDFTDASGNMWYDNTLRILIETTDWFIPLSDTEGSYTSAYDINISGTSNLDNTDIDGTFTMDGTAFDVNSTSTVTIDNTNTGNGVVINAVTSGGVVSIGHTTSETTVNDNLTVTAANCSSFPACFTNHPQERFAL